MKKIILIISANVLLLASCGTAKIAKGEHALENMEYYHAAKYFEESLNAKTSLNLFSKIAFCYQKMNKNNEAAKWYKKSIENGTFENDDLYNYAICLRLTGNEKEAKFWLQQFLEKVPESLNAKIMKESCDSLEAYLKDSALINVKMLDLNIDETYFSATWYENGLVFCSAAKEKPVYSTWNGQPYLDLYKLEINEKGHFEEVQPLACEINSNYHEGPGVFNSIYNTIYFTRNLLKNGKPQKNENDESVLKIYTADYKENNWLNITPLPFSINKYNTAHPALNRNEDYLYFTSDMPGGFGGFDLYKISFKDGEWGTPENLGIAINTAGNELFPTINYDSFKGIEYLYFSSDGKHGMGGLDIYKVEISGLYDDNAGNSKQSISPMGKNNEIFLLKVPIVEHLHYPINSMADDMSLITKNSIDSGYFSSSRGSIEGKDKIYTFAKVKFNYYLKGVVKNKTDLSIIADADVSITQTNGTDKYELKTDSLGAFIIKIDTNELFLIEGKKEMFYKNHIEANSFNLTKSDTIEVELLLEQILLNCAIRLDNIYYDYNKWDIRLDAKPELDKLVKLMVENPEIKVELSSHTDSRGKDKYNMTLSQKRAESAVNYIISTGISPLRIYAKGYGESVLLNNCTNKQKCSEDEHQINRRTEFKVVKIDVNCLLNNYE